MSDSPAARIGAEDVSIVTAPSPHEVRNPETRREIGRAAVWVAVAGAAALVVVLIQPLLVVFAGLVFASLLDGGIRLLGRVLPIGRGWRMLIVVLLAAAFLIGTFYLAGVQITEQVIQLRTTVEAQAVRVTAWLSSQGLMPGASDLSGLARQAMGSIGRLTSFVGTAAGAITTMVMIFALGLFVAGDPRVYERGVQWMIPQANRAEFSVTLARMAQVMRRLLAGRLLGMAVEGVLTAVALWLVGVPMALILGIITGLLAFIPNVGAIVSGVLMAAAGFSAGWETGCWAIGVYFVVQNFDGYVVIPMVAKRTVDMPPALTLGAQILTSALFGILGLALADPLTAMIKTALERRSEAVEQQDQADAASA